MAWQETEKIGPYRIVNQIGKGGMATVYKAYHDKLSRYVAIKVIHQIYQADGGFLARFEREAQIVANLDHPHIVPVYDYAEHQGSPYLVMKFVEGGTLKDVMEKVQLPPGEIIRIMSAVASALTYAHEAGVLHRDVKPSNVMIDKSGFPYLSDFGLARITYQGSSTLSSEMMMGTPQYMSPEQGQGADDLDGRTDVYSFGVMLYELLARRTPFVADTPYAIVHQHIYDLPPFPSEVNPALPVQIDPILLKALAKDPAERYLSPNELMNAFRRAALESELVALPAPRSMKPSSKPRLTSINPPDTDASITKPKPPTLPSRPQRTPPPASTNMVSFTVPAEPPPTPAPLPPNALREEPLINVADLRRRFEAETHRERSTFINRVGLFVALVVVMLLLNGIIQNLLLNLYNEARSPALYQLAALSVPLIVILIAGRALAQRGVKMFYNSGERLETRFSAVDHVMVERHGADWQYTASETDYDRVERAVGDYYRQRIAFFQHAATGLVVIALTAHIWEPVARALAILMLRSAPALARFIVGLPLVVVVIVVGCVLVGSEAYKTFSNPLLRTVQPKPIESRTEKQAEAGLAALRAQRDQRAARAKKMNEALANRKVKN